MSANGAAVMSAMSRSLTLNFLPATRVTVDPASTSEAQVQILQKALGRFEGGTRALVAMADERATMTASGIAVSRMIKPDVPIC